MIIPVIDFCNCGLNIADSQVSNEAYQEVGRQIYEACSTAGFTYLSRTGIARAKADAVNDAASNFFAQPLEYKNKFLGGNVGESSYIPLGGMKLHPKRPFDYQEGYRVGVLDNPDSWPEIPNMKESVQELKNLCKKLLLRVCLALGYGMDLKNPRTLADSHQFLNDHGNDSSMKLIHYPPITDDAVLAEGQLRIAEHTDFGSMTLLFHDDVGGLQVQTPDGDFIDAPYIPETILLNIGDMMQFWTKGRLKSTVHRVVLPSDPDKLLLTRRSITYFANADHDVLLSELEFNNSEITKKKPETECITSKEYFLRRFKDAYD